MKVPTQIEMNKLLKDLRTLAPGRSLSYGESLCLARMQAVKLRQWARVNDTAEFPLGWWVNQKNPGELRSAT